MTNGRILRDCAQPPDLAYRPPCREPHPVVGGRRWRANAGAVLRRCPGGWRPPATSDRPFGGFWDRLLPDSPCAIVKSETGIISRDFDTEVRSHPGEVSTPPRSRCPQGLGRLASSTRTQSPCIPRGGGVVQVPAASGRTGPISERRPDTGSRTRAMYD
jgi:hypothetical protein